MHSADSHTESNREFAKKTDTQICNHLKHFLSIYYLQNLPKPDQNSMVKTQTQFRPDAFPNFKSFFGDNGSAELGLTRMAAHLLKRVGSLCALNRTISETAARRLLPVQ